MLYNLGSDRTAFTRSRIGATVQDTPYHSAGCRCSLCFGLHEFMERLTGKDYGLPKAPGITPEPVKAEPTPCESMTCICPKCSAKRAQMRPKRVPQPWDVRRARAA
jgi:hypothetical protein